MAGGTTHAQSAHLAAVDERLLAPAGQLHKHAKGAHRHHAAVVDGAHFRWIICAAAARRGSREQQVCPSQCDIPELIHASIQCSTAPHYAAHLTASAAGAGGRGQVSHGGRAPLPGTAVTSGGGAGSGCRRAAGGCGSCCACCRSHRGCAGKVSAAACHLHHSRVHLGFAEARASERAHLVLAVAYFRSHAQQPLPAKACPQTCPAVPLTTLMAPPATAAAARPAAAPVATVAAPPLAAAVAAGGRRAAVAVPIVPFLPAPAPATRARRASPACPALGVRHPAGGRCWVGAGLCQHL